MTDSPKDEKVALSATGSTENSPLGEKVALPVTDLAESSPIAEQPESSGDADETTSTTTVGDSPVDAEDDTPVETKPAADVVENEKELPAVKEEKYIPPPPPRRRVGLPAANGVSTKQDLEKAGREDDDGNSYVGDATWEERTWKEITRLREDMFWARIGSVRN